MIQLAEFLQSDVASDMAVSLLHTLWQAAIIALGLLFVLKSICASRTEFRYRLSILSIFAIVVCWLGTFSILQYEPVDDSAVQDQAQPVTVTTVNSTTTDIVESVTHKKSDTNPLSTAAAAITDNASQDSEINYVGWGLTVWSAGVCIMVGRLFAALAGAARLKRHAVDIDDPRLTELFESLCQRMNIRRKIRFAASKTLLHPGVIGFWRPVLLVPASILSEISVEDLQTILAHELAHIRRYDYLINFCQMIVESLLFFNPAVWWVSRRIRIEREACCDVAGVETAGERSEYARILFEQIAKTAKAPQTAMTAAITGFSDSGCDSSEERIARITHPQHKPSMKIGWVKLMLGIGIAGIVLLGLWKTTDVTVAMAAKIMTPVERIEKMTEIAESHSGEYKTYKDTDRVSLSGKVTTEDGKPLPKNPKIFIKAYGPRHSSGVHFNIQKDGTFNHFVRCHQNVFVAVEVPEYAPGYSQTYHPEPNDVIDNIHIVLTDGFTAKVKVVDEQGNPIPDATLNKHYFIQKRDGWSGYGHSDKVVTDEDGIALFEHCLEKPVKMNVQADGYQKIDSGDYTLKPNEITRITLTKGLTASGIVVAQETGEPIPNAKFKLVYKETPGHGWHHGVNGQDYEATTDSLGKFTLDTLVENFKYTFVIEADEYNRAVLAKVQPGDKKIRVEMLPELYITGKVVGDIEKLGKSYCSQIKKTVPALRFDSRFSDDNYNDIYENDSIPVDIVDGVGFFELKNILGDEVILRAVGTEKRITVKIDGKSVDDAVIDLNASDNFHNNMPTRSVILTFQSPPEYPPVEGTGKVWYMTKEVEQSDHRQWSGIDMLVENGVAIIDFPVPAYFRLAETKGITGFWIEAEPWDTKNHNFITAAEEPYERTIIAEPAGKIYGQILDDQGKLKSYADLKLLLVERPQKYQNYDGNFHQIKNKITDFHGHNATDTGRFNTHPLPLGGTYAIVAYDDQTWLISEPIELTEENPIQEIALQLDSTTQISGRVLLPDNTPAADIEILLGVSVRYSDEGRYGVTGHKINTDENGSFLYEKINPQKPLKYDLRIKPGPGYQPLNVDVKPGSDKTYRVKKGYTLKGRIVDDQTGWPIPGASIGAESMTDRSDYKRIRTCDSPSDKDGNFIFTSLNNEQYRLYMGDADIISPSLKEREVTGGKDEWIEVRVKLRSYSQLRLRKPDDVE